MGFLTTISGSYPIVSPALQSHPKVSPMWLLSERERD